MRSRMPRAWHTMLRACESPSRMLVGGARSQPGPLTQGGAPELQAQSCAACKEVCLSRVDCSGIPEASAGLCLSSVASEAQGKSTLHCLHFLTKQAEALSREGWGALAYPRPAAVLPSQGDSGSASCLLGRGVQVLALPVPWSARSIRKGLLFLPPVSPGTTAGMNKWRKPDTIKKCFQAQTCSRWTLSAAL